MMSISVSVSFCRSKVGTSNLLPLGNNFSIELDEDENETNRNKERERFAEHVVSNSNFTMNLCASIYFRRSRSKYQKDVVICNVGEDFVF